jgi:hypothetical protein
MLLESKNAIIYGAGGSIGGARRRGRARSSRVASLTTASAMGLSATLMRSSRKR